MKLQILINHYNESESVIKKLLKSIEMQEAVTLEDFEVLIYSDGKSNKLSEEFLHSFHFPITYRALEHRGVCATRNALLDDATADYVMFCDADDCFHSTLGLYQLLKAIKDLNLNCIGSPYEHEYIASDGTLQYETFQRDTIRVHGKVFKRSYLVENDIRFPEDLPFSGDMYFLWQAYNIEVSFAWVLNSFYTWKYNKNSVTRSDKQHLVNSYPILIQCYNLLMEKLTERKRPELCQRLAIANIQMMYLHDNIPNYVDGQDDKIQAAHKIMAEYISHYGHIYTDAPEELKTAMFEMMTKQIYNNKDIKLDGITSWINKIMKIS